MTNTQAVELFAKKKQIKDARDKAQKAFDKAQAAWNKVKEITEIYEGKALCVQGMCVSAPWTNRTMEAYKGSTREDISHPDSVVDDYREIDYWYITQYNGKRREFCYTHYTTDKRTLAKINKKIRDFVAYGKEWRKN